MMGFSAGGHLASTAGTHFDGGDPHAPDPIHRAGSRPDFLILAYAVITMEPPYAHESSVIALLGEHPDRKLREELSNELRVTAQTPPTFLFATNADDVVPAENSAQFYMALRKAGVPAELHIFEKGPHGVGLDLSDPALGEWPKLLEEWMRGRGLLQFSAAQRKMGILVIVSDRNLYFTDNKTLAQVPVKTRCIEQNIALFVC